MVEIGSHNDLDSINIENEENFVIQDPKPKQTLGSVARVTPTPHPLPSLTAPKPKKPEEDAHSLNFQDDVDSLLEDENFEEMTAESMEIPQQVDIPVWPVIYLPSLNEGGSFVHRPGDCHNFSLREVSKNNHFIIDIRQ